MALLGIIKRHQGPQEGPAIVDMTSNQTGELPEAEVIGTIPSDEEKNKVQTDTAAIEQESHNDPEIAALPLQVRQIINLTDDPTLFTITFRYFVLSALFVIPGAFLSQMSYFRTTSAPYSVFFVQIACHYVGHFLAKILPAWTVRLPGTSWSFNLNPGPWSIKEHVLVTVTAASGATYNLAYAPIVLAELWYGTRINPAVAIFFMWAIVWTGYSFAALARQILLPDPEYIWPQALMQTTLFETFRKTDTSSPIARRQMKVFFLAFLGMTLWQFLPEYVFPFLSSLAFLCWVAPHNAVANFIGSGLGGMGLLNLSLDWSNINWNGSSIMLTPFWTQVILFLAYAFNCWVLIPAAKWGGLGSYKHGLMSNSVLMANGTTYPTLQVLTPEYHLNETAYQQYGPMYMGLQNVWSTWFDYAKLPAAVTWIATFGYVQIRNNIKKILGARKISKSSPESGIHHQYHDRLNVIQRQYKEIPLWWYLSLFLTALVILIIIIGKVFVCKTLACGNLFIPIWTLFVGLASAVVFVVPFAWLYAISNYQLETGSFNELMYGYMVHTKAGSSHSTHVAPQSTAPSLVTHDQKIGHYMHIPPREIFFSQIFGTLMGVPINYAVIRWVMDTKGDYLTGVKTDPLNQWTGQKLRTSNTMGVQYAVLGPKRLFAEAEMTPLPWSFLVGAVIPPILFIFHRFFPRLRIDLWNVSIFFGGLAMFYGNVSTGYTSAIIGGYVVMYWDIGAISKQADLDATLVGK
ncbi:Oligopeptide transporter OPT superfamily [Penicillium sp. IBT 16267x]|nr:Oligopeptide transporter OPT superfamily [Penicillium sp. IBT 16267x]